MLINAACMANRIVQVQVMESPNDSYPWIKFMAFHIELGEVAKARAVAERALQTIHFRHAPWPLKHPVFCTVTRVGAAILLGL